MNCWLFSLFFSYLAEEWGWGIERKTTLFKDKMKALLFAFHFQNILWHKTFYSDIFMFFNISTLLTLTNGDIKLAFTRSSSSYLCYVSKSPLSYLPCYHPSPDSFLKNLTWTNSSNVYLVHTFTFQSIYRLVAMWILLRTPYILLPAPESSCLTNKISVHQTRVWNYVLRHSLSLPIDPSRISETTCMFPCCVFVLSLLPGGSFIFICIGPWTLQIQSLGTNASRLSENFSWYVQGKTLTT